MIFSLSSPLMDLLPSLMIMALMILSLSSPLMGLLPSLMSLVPSAEVLPTARTQSASGFIDAQGVRLPAAASWLPAATRPPLPGGGHPAAVPAGPPSYGAHPDLLQGRLFRPPAFFRFSCRRPAR